MRPVPSITQYSIAAAKAAQQRERAEARKAGIRITAEGYLVPAFACRQPGCAFVATARREMQAINGLSAHLVYAHVTDQRAKGTQL